ncbi:MAG: kynureninase, partial [Acidobacteriota bacterium]
MTPAAPVQPEDLYRRPNALAAEYSRFRVAERLLLTGHSHQAWPDRALAGQIRAFEDAAEQVDEKWSRAFAVAGEVARGYARRMGDDGPGGGTYALAANTHDLLIRFLSSLPLRGRPRLLTTDGEFHTIRRQLRRLEEDGWVEVERVPAADPDALPDLLAQRVDDRTAAVLVSSVLFRSARVVRGLGTVARAAERHGAELLVDVYHHVNALPLDLAAEGLGDAYVVGGGYKYCQLGEGNCFLRVPPGRRPRPVVTGWFAEFEA